MSLSLAAACLWALVANVIAMFPSKHQHWPAGYGLIALLAGMSILRWSVRYLFRWVVKTVRG